MERLLSLGIFCVLVMMTVTFTSAVTNASEISYLFISQKEKGSGTPEALLSLKTSNILEDLGCYLNSQGAENIYEPSKEVNVFEDFLRVFMNISEIPSCLWLFKESTCKPLLNSENQYVSSLAFSQIKETQAGKYTLSVKKTSNYTLVVPVLITKLGKPYFRKREKSKFISEIPQPSVEWIFFKSPEKSCTDKMHEETGEIGIQKIQYKLFQSFICCCAVNDLGRECSSLFIIDLNGSKSVPLPELLLQVGKPLLIRCRAVPCNYKFGIQLSFENKEIKEPDQLRLESGLSPKHCHPACRGFMDRAFDTETR
ncbi:LOW QUALITY PROTEIN: receptor-type tyrosine-protein kinase FLT3 [Phaethornis superciliosus]